MDNRQIYKTKQRQMITDYLKNVKGDHITASDVYAHLKSEGTPVALATVYRQLEKLVDDGIINKYTTGSGSPACFEYIGGDCEKDHVCYHCKCEKCGKLIHLHCDELNEINDHIRNDHRFKIDTARTVFYGLCEDCSN